MDRARANNKTIDADNPEAGITPMNSKSNITRRACLKAFASVAVLPFMPKGAIAAISSPAPKIEGSHRILTCNILLDLPEQEGKMSWKQYRRDLCMKVITLQNADLICLQEVGRSQNEELIKAFPDYDSFGFVDPASDTNPPRFKAIRNVIFFSKARYEMIFAGSYWMTESPLIAASILPKQSMGRHVNWLRLKEKSTGIEFRILNTHFALKAHERLAGAKIVAAETSQYNENFPQIMAGDFNAELGSDELKPLQDAGWVDTFTTTPGTVIPTHRRKIDFIFARGKVKCVGARIIDENIDGVKPSDHFFVSADVFI